jgi:hypothetical protein
MRRVYKLILFYVIYYRGPFEDVLRESERFENENNGKPVRLLSDAEVTALI